VGGAFAWVQLSARPPVPVAAVTPPPVTPPDVVPAVPVTPAPAADGAAAGNAMAAAPSATNAVAATAPAPLPAAPEPAKVAEAAPPRKAKAPPPAPPRPARPQVAQAAPPAPRPAAPAAAAAPAKKKDGLLDFDQGGDDDLAAALGSGSGGRKVYVPPATGAATAAPDRLSDGQIMESVKLHSEALRRCVSEQQAREPGVKGTIKVSWVVQQDGVPRDVRCLTPEYAQGEFAKCMIAVVRGIRFGRVGDPKGQPVTFPFQF